MFLSNYKKVSFQKWSGNQVINDNLDCFVITGAGIIDVNCFRNKPVVNAHPGIIPTSRGLDSFKWAILNNYQLGITLHFIDREVDKGKILCIKKTPIYLSDTIEMLARRHYELEIFILSKTLDFLENSQEPLTEQKPARMRMPRDTEKIMLDNFEKWKHNQLKISN